MKKIQSKIYVFIGLILISLSGFSQNFQPINVDTTPVSQSCNVNGGNFTATVPAEALSGDLIPLNITLPGTLPDSCAVNISISYSSPNNKLQFVSSSMPFFNSSGTLISTGSFAGNQGYNFNVFFRFFNHYTCNGETGTLTVTFDACGQTCSVTVNVTARAGNYWTVKKEFVAGNLVCGTSKWRFIVQNNNPNPSNYGNYILNGTITETTSLPVNGNNVISYNNLSNGLYLKYVYLSNCQNEGTVITNTADYNFTLGDGCTTMQGSVSAVSDTLAAPNGSVSFIKRIYSSSGYVTGSNNLQQWAANYDITPGCDGQFLIRLDNNGNVPWTDIQISDNLNIPGLTITGISLPPGWSSSPSLPQSNLNQNFTFSSPSGFVLNPDSSINIIIHFTVDNTFPVGSTIPNTATASYVAAGTGTGNSGSGGSPSTCQGVNCPTLDTSVQNDTAHAYIHTIDPVSVPRIYKWVQNAPPNRIYQVGDTISFRIQVRNYGAGDLTETVTDALNGSGQNLSLISGSVNFQYFEWNGTNHVPTPISNPFSVTNNSSANNLSIDITNMPGNCELGRYNYLEIYFDAIILPQLYGSKTNRAYLDNNIAHDRYTVDQIGILEVKKRADQEFIENGSNFNYIIEVTNNGSVPLDHLSISDQMPSCISVSQGIHATDFSGNNINLTVSGNLNVQIDPAFALQPGQTLTLSIPAVKQGGGQCCNENVTAQGTMTTSGVLLEANYGTPDEPAACVKSSECCDIVDFEAHLYQSPNGGYQVSINGGAVPLQEIQISMMDYHVEYNNEDCKPDNMGMFGQMTTSHTHLDGLILDSLSNGSYSLLWQAGNASVIQENLTLNIQEPQVLNLDCCEVDFYFCLKIKVKDVNCNVCEKVICLEPKPEPCDLTVQVENFQRNYCLSDELNISWSGNSTGDCVNVYLISPDGSQTIQIASGQADNGSLTWTIPQNFKDCGKKWKIAVADCETPRECYAVTEIFTIDCCGKCDCGQWESNRIEISEKPIVQTDTIKWPGEKRFQSDSNEDLSPSLFYQGNTTCGGTVTLKPGSYQFTPPSFNCNPDNESCNPEFKWHLVSPNNQIDQWSTGNVFQFNFIEEGNYGLYIYPQCGDQECKPCQMTVIIENCNEECNMFEDFEPGPVTNWNMHNAVNLVTNSGELYVKDGSGGSYIYSHSFPRNLTEQGCVLKYKVKYKSGDVNNNGYSSNNSLIIYISNGSGLPINTSVRAVFVLNSSSEIPSDGQWHTVEVPLQLASGNSLPSNAYGSWVMSGHAPGDSNYTPSEINSFNNLIQNVEGIAFFLDEGSNPAEEWWYDDFCFKKCCNKPTSGGNTDQSTNNK